MIQLNYYGRAVAREGEELITAGSVGLQISLGFDEAWDGLTKVACFRGAGKAVDVVLSGTGTGAFDPINIPAEVMAKAGARIEVGVYGTNGQGTVVIPAVWAVIGAVKAGAIPSGATPGAITPSLAQQCLDAAEAAQDAAEDAQEAAEAAQEAAEAAQAAAQNYTAQYTATADAETGELTFSETPEYADVRAAIVAGRTCKATVRIGNDTYYAPLGVFHDPPAGQGWRVEYVLFRSPKIWVKELSNGSTTGAVEVS